MNDGKALRDLARGKAVWIELWHPGLGTEWSVRIVPAALDWTPCEGEIVFIVDGEDARPRLARIMTIDRGRLHVQTRHARFWIAPMRVLGVMIADREPKEKK